MAHSENFSSDTWNQGAQDKEKRSAEYCEQRSTQQYQGEDHENSIIRASHLHLSVGDQLKSRFSREEFYQCNNQRHKVSYLSNEGNETCSIQKGQDSACNNSFNYRD